MEISFLLINENSFYVILGRRFESSIVWIKPEEFLEFMSPESEHKAPKCLTLINCPLN